MTSCRHNGTWIIAGGTLEWCWRCGAMRDLRRVAPGVSTPESYWTAPVGEAGENPYPLRKRKRQPQTQEVKHE